jgi:hypothetical protein
VVILGGGYFGRRTNFHMTPKQKRKADALYAKARKTLILMRDKFVAAGVPRVFAMELIILTLYRINPDLARQVDDQRLLRILREERDKQQPGKPYFARRKLTKEFAKLNASSKTGKGTDSTQLISEDRDINP